MQAIEQFPVSATKKIYLMHFLKFVGYYRCFCRKFSSVVVPPTNMLKKNVKYEWSPFCQQAFDQVKRLLCASPVLSVPRLQHFQIYVDESHVGAGAFLTQMDALGTGRPVSYFSKKFDKHQSTLQWRTRLLP